jgi:hypothetical protein
MNGSSRLHALLRFVGAVTLGAMSLAAAGCEIEAGPDYPGGTYLEYPPDGYIATTEPWYYDGQACYWYGGFWYYRNGGRWGRYDREPAALHARRLQGGGQVRHGYEPGGRGAGRGGRGGGRGGGRSSGGHR